MGYLPKNCDRCGGVLTMPSETGIRAAAAGLVRAGAHLDDPIALAMDHGIAAAFLMMVADCMRGLCLNCQQAEEERKARAA